MKKIICLIAFFLFSLNIVKAQEALFTIEEVTGIKNELITINLNISDNPSFGLLGVKLNYDQSILKYDSADIIGLDKAFMKDVAEENGVLTMYALCLDNKKLMDDTGNILQAKFKIISDEVSDTKITIDVTDFAIDEITTLEYKATDGLVKIKKTVAKNTQVNFDEQNSQENIQYSSSDENIATVDNSGNINFKQNGNVTIKAKLDNGEVLEKEYVVKEKIEEAKQLKDNQLKVYPLILIAIGAVALLVGLIILFKRKKKSYEKKKS